MLNQELRCWLRGYLDLGEGDAFTAVQLRIIRNHINLTYAVTGGLDTPNRHAEAIVAAALDNLEDPFQQHGYTLLLKQIIDDSIPPPR